MKIKSLAAAGAIGVGLGLAGLFGGTGVASADCSSPTIPNDTPPPDEIPNPDFTPPLSPARVACVTNEQLSEFGRTISPAYNLDVLVNGTKDNPELGLVNQPGEFVRSVGDFFNGPRSPEPAPESANGF